MRIAREVGRVVNTRIDIIINILIAELVRLDYELPMFSALVKIAEKEHDAAEQALYTGSPCRAKRVRQCNTVCTETPTPLRSPSSTHPRGTSTFTKKHL